MLVIALINAWALTFGWWAHEMSGKSPLFSWVTHGLAAIPLCLLVRWQPWTAPGAVFAYRELEQMWHRYLNQLPMLWGDHFMDVAVPTVVGWFFLEHLGWLR